MTDDLVPLNGSTEPPEAQGFEMGVWLWQTFVRMYGTTFLNQYGEKPDQVWVWALGKLDREAVKRGVAGCMESGGDFPPSLPKFLEYCNPKPQKSAGVRFLGNPTDPRYLLSVPKASVETAQRHIESMRRKLEA